MGLRINTNITALNAHSNMVKTDNRLSNSLSRLSSGLRINKAADDASGMIIADSLKAQHMGIGQAIKNANDGISIVQTADGALKESINIVNTIKTKAIQAASDGQTTKTRTAIQNDIDKLMEELDTIAKTTSYNGHKLLSGAFTNKKIQIGAYTNETADISINSTESSKIGHTSTSDLTLEGNGGEVQLTITSSITGEKLTLNKIDIQKNNQAENSMGALADEINKHSVETGIAATAVVQSTTENSIKAGSINNLKINGIAIGDITVKDNDEDQKLVSAINSRSAEHGVSASIEKDGRLTLTSSDGRAIAVSGDVNDVLGTTANDMSTIGYIALNKSGSSQFDIKGIGATATGTAITVGTAAVVTSEESILKAGSSITAGSILKAGTVVGGEATLTASTGDSTTEAEIKTGSVIAAGSEMSTDTVLGGNMTLAGNTGATAKETTATKGSSLAANSIIAKGTVITTAFKVGTVNYSVGDTLTDAVTLGAALTLNEDMTLAKGSDILAASILNTGTELGAKITTSGATTLEQDMILKKDGDLNTGSKLAAGSILGADTTVGDMTTYMDTTLAKGSAMAVGTSLAQGSQVGGRVEVASDSVLQSDMSLKADSNAANTTVLEEGSILKAGTVVNQNMLIGGVTVGAGTILDQDMTLSADIALTSDMILKEGSTIKSGSFLAVNTDNSGTVDLTESESYTLSDINVLTQKGAQKAIKIAESALESLDETRAGLGSTQNQLSSTISNLSVTKTNVQASESAIRDVDFAEESMNYGKMQLLAQTGSYAMAQANASSKNIMSLLQ